MTFISITRLRLRSLRFLPFFAVHTFGALQQVKKAPGFRTGSLLQDGALTYWTMTAWDTQETMRNYVTAGAHKKAMPHLIEWCDEASVVHWEQRESALPTWREADRRMRESGRASKLSRPSPSHANLTYHEPKTFAGVPIHRAR